MPSAPGATSVSAAAIGDPEVLKGLATDVGLDADEVRSVLEGDAYAVEVRADERRGAALGITGVPFFVIDGTYGVSGAQPPDVLLGVLEEAWARSDRLVSAGGDSPGCSDDTCSVAWAARVRTHRVVPRRPGGGGTGDYGSQPAHRSWTTVCTANSASAADNDGR